RSGNELAMLSLRASDRDGQGSNRLSKIECVWGLGCPKTHHEIKDTLDNFFDVWWSISCRSVKHSFLRAWQ
ncbi:MAG: hypothetical protein RPU60_03915, partial [Candidatus Sedimenticola sp. (ex Thyasira tokunagai)]